MKTVFQQLDNWVLDFNRESDALPIRACHFQLLGQSALMEANCDLTLVQTADVDAYTNASHAVLKKFDELLAPLGKHLDPLSQEIWMPAETVFLEYYKGEYITVEIAQIEFVLLSKACKAPNKNKALLIEYLSKEPTDQFFELVDKYQVNIEELING